MTPKVPFPFVKSSLLVLGRGVTGVRGGGGVEHPYTAPERKPGHQGIFVWGGGGGRWG